MCVCVCVSENLILEKLDLLGKVSDDTGIETDQHGTESQPLETTPTASPPTKRHRISEHDLSRELF